MLLRRVRTSVTASANRHFSAAMDKAPASQKDGEAEKETLGERLLRLVHPKRGPEVELRKWKEEGRTIATFELNRAVRELRKLKRYKHALEICEWKTKQKDIELQAGDYALHLDLVAKVHGISKAERFFSQIPGPMANHSAYSALLHSYVQSNLTSKAESLIAKMSESGLIQNPLPYNHMLALYISNGQLDKVPELIRELKRNTSPDIITYNKWLTYCLRRNDVEAAEEVFSELKEAKLKPDWEIHKALTDLYMKNGFTMKAMDSLKEMERLASRETRVVYSVLLRLRMSIGDKAGVRWVWKKMKLLFEKLNDAEYTCMIASLLKLDELKEAENIYAEWESVSGSKDSRVGNLLLAAYINGDRMGTAEKFWERMSGKGVKVSYTTLELLTRGYLKLKESGKAIAYFESAIKSVLKWNPDEKLVTEVLNLVEKEGSVERAEKLLEVLRSVGYMTTEIYNSVLRTYANAGKMPLLVEERMKKDGVPMDKDTRKLVQYFGLSTTALEKALVSQNEGHSLKETLGERLASLVQPKCSVKVPLTTWKEEGHKVGTFELNKAIRKLREDKQYKEALEMCEWKTKQKDIELKPSDYAIQLDLVAKVHGVQKAEKFFDQIPAPMANHMAYSTLLHSYVRSNLSSKAQSLMEKMSDSGLIHDPLPYNYMLALYISNGQLDKVPALIRELKRNTSPDIVTYNKWLMYCLRQNDVEAAEEVLSELKEAKLKQDWITHSTLTSLYMKKGFRRKAMDSLKEMEKLVSRKNRVVYLSLLGRWASIGDEAGVQRVWNKMKLLFEKLNDAEYTCMISSLLKLDELKEAESVYAEWESLSGIKDSRVSNILLAAYINGDKLGTAEKFCDRMSEKGFKASYTNLELLTWGYVKQKESGKAVAFFESAVKSVPKWNPDEKLVTEVFGLVEEEGSVERAEKLLEVLRSVGQVTTEIYNSVLRTYANAGTMPFLVEERMNKDGVPMDEETRKLVKLTAKMRVSELSSSFLKSLT